MQIEQFFEGRDNDVESREAWVMASKLSDEVKDQFHACFTVVSGLRLRSSVRTSSMGIAALKGVGATWVWKIETV